jgi:UDP-glucose 6-dehydrogenase
MAACLAAVSYEVLALDPDPALVEQLSAVRTPVAEPGLGKLIASGLRADRLPYYAPEDPSSEQADVFWIAFDKRVDDDEFSDGVWVLEQAASALAGASEEHSRRRLVTAARRQPPPALAVYD